MDGERHKLKVYATIKRHLHLEMVSFRRRSAFSTGVRKSCFAASCCPNLSFMCYCRMDSVQFVQDVGLRSVAVFRFGVSIA